MWQDKPHDSADGESDVHCNQRLGSLLSSNKWQMQHEHLLQKVSTMESVALQAEFLQIHVLEHLESEHGSVIGGIRIGFSPFLFCFWLFGLVDVFLESWFFDGFLFIFLDALLISKVDNRSPDFKRSSILLQASCLCFSHLLQQVHVPCP